MKKLFSILIISLTTLGIMSFTGCESENESGLKSQKYEPKSIIMSSGDKKEYSVYLDESAKNKGYKKDSEEYNNYLKSMEISYTFDDNGKAVGTQGTVKVEGTYTLTDDELDIILGSNKVIMTYDDETDELIASDKDTGMSTIFSSVE